VEKVDVKFQTQFGLHKSGSRKLSLKNAMTSIDQGVAVDGPTPRIKAIFNELCLVSVRSGAESLQVSHSAQSDRIPLQLIE
jgi:hypothetical protein